MKTFIPLKYSFLSISTFQWFTLIVVFCIFSACQKEQARTVKHLKAFDILDKKQPLDLTLTTDLTILFKKKESGFQKAHCQINKQHITLYKDSIKIKKRGVIRKKICGIPPLMLKFGNGKDKLKLKLVTPCHEGEEFQQLVYKEYLTYQLYSQLTDYSFKTQLVNITYIDRKGQQLPMKMKGFLIEPQRELAHRVTAEVMPSSKKLKFIDQHVYRLFTMFQYFIGNTDWNLNKRHNIKLICKTDSETPIPIPYDFDYAGLVNAPYAIPHPQLPIDNVKQRHLMWRGKKQDKFETVIQSFEEKKEILFSILEEFPHLEEETKNEMLHYLESFYQKIENEGLDNHQLTNLFKTKKPLI